MTPKKLNFRLQKIIYLKKYHNKEFDFKNNNEK